VHASPRSRDPDDLKDLMHISYKVDYGVRAMVAIARSAQSGQPVRLADVSGGL